MRMPMFAAPVAGASVQKSTLIYEHCVEVFG